LLDLLSGHPSPFLAESTVSESSRALAEIVRRADEPWRPGRKQSEENKLLPEDSWPTQLRIGFPYDMLGPGPEARRTVEELSESTPEFARYWRVPDEAALAAAREKLQQLDNPVGRLLADSAIGTLPSCVDMLFRNRALREATKAVLAVRLYQIQRGRLPDDMHSLVTAGVLAAVPADPFADAPLGYSRERAEIWSVGPKNDAAVWMGKMTWSVSPI